MPAHPVLFCLSGTLKGATVTPRGNPIVLGSAAECTVRFPPSAARPVAERHAEIEERDGQWIVRSLVEEPILLNDQPVQQGQLQQNDLVRLGKKGPVFRFRLSENRRPTKTFQQMVTDATDYASEVDGRRRTRASRMTSFARQLVVEAVANGTRRFRIALGVMAILIVALAVALIRTMMDASDTQRTNEQRAQTDKEAIERLLSMLEEANTAAEAQKQEADERRRELENQLKALVKRDQEKDRLLEDLAKRTDGMAKRLSAAEDLAGAAKRIHRDFHKGVCFIYVGVSFYSETEKQFVRLVVDPKTGKPDPMAAVPVKMGGKGPKLMEWVSGSGFVVDEEGHVVSNRHVLDPWHEDPTFGEPLLQRGLRAVREVFIACFPGREDPVPLIRVGVHAKMDVAVAKLTTMDENIPVLPLGDADAKLDAGTDVYVLGYPEGLLGIIHKLPTEQAQAVMSRSKDRRADLVTNLSKMKGIDPVFTKGQLSNINAAQLVYDAVTFGGGSGGPVFTEAGEVIGVNTAISRQFTGANYGTPIRFAHEVLKAGKLDKATYEFPELPSKLAVEKK